MTMIDLFISFPMWAKVLILLIGAIWLFETLLLPFKINLCINHLKRLEGLMKQILSQTKVNKVLNEDSQKILSLLLGYMGKENKK